MPQSLWAKFCESPARKICRYPGKSQHKPGRFMALVFGPCFSSFASRCAWSQLGLGSKCPVLLRSWAGIGATGTHEIWTCFVYGSVGVGRALEGLDTVTGSLCVIGGRNKTEEDSILKK